MDNSPLSGHEENSLKNGSKGIVGVLIAGDVVEDLVGTLTHF